MGDGGVLGPIPGAPTERVGMNHQQQLRQKKAQRRKEKIRHRQHQRQQLHVKCEKWPQFIIDRDNTENVPPAFMAAVEEVLARTKVSDPETFSPESREVLRQLKKHGGAEYARKVSGAQSIAEILEVLKPLMLEAGGILQRALLAKGAAIAQYLPMCNVFLLPSRDILVQVRAMDRVKGPHGTIYHAPRRQTVEIDGTHYILGYTRHAVERIAERETLDPREYSSARATFVFLTDVIEGELVHLHGGAQPALAIFNTCEDEKIAELYNLGIRGVPPDNGKQLRYRLGYAPLSLCNGFAVAKTFLTPGMVGTPEYELLTRRAQGEMEATLSASVQRSISFKDVCTHRDFTAFRWFHENGIEQIVELDAGQSLLGVPGPNPVDRLCDTDS